MPRADLHANLRQWGGGLGIFIPADITRKLNAKPGGRVHVHIEYEPERNDAERLPTWKAGRAVDIDAILDEELGS